MGALDNQEGGDEDGTDDEGSSEKGPEARDSWGAVMRRGRERALQDYMNGHGPALRQGPRGARHGSVVGADWSGALLCVHLGGALASGLAEPHGYHFAPGRLDRWLWRGVAHRSLCLSVGRGKKSALR